MRGARTATCEPHHGDRELARSLSGIAHALVLVVGDVIQELEAPVDGHYFVRVYASSSVGRWQAWLEFTSLEHGDLSRTGILRTAATREELVRWARELDTHTIHRALEDAELASATELGTTPRPEGRLAPTR